MGDFIILGISFTVTVVSLIVGAYFLHTAYSRRADMDKLSLNMFVAIGVGSFSTGLSRVYTLPILYGVAANRPDLVQTTREYVYIFFALLAICAWSYILHLKPVFYWVSYPKWAAWSVIIVMILTTIGALVPYFTHVI